MTHRVLCGLLLSSVMLTSGVAWANDYENLQSDSDSVGNPIDFDPNGLSSSNCSTRGDCPISIQKNTTNSFSIGLKAQVVDPPPVVVDPPPVVVDPPPVVNTGCDGNGVVPLRPSNAGIVPNSTNYGMFSDYTLKSDNGTMMNFPMQCFVDIPNNPDVGNNYRQFQWSTGQYLSSFYDQTQGSSFYIPITTNNKPQSNVYNHYTCFMYEWNSPVFINKFDLTSSLNGYFTSGASLTYQLYMQDESGGWHDMYNASNQKSPMHDDASSPGVVDLTKRTDQAGGDGVTSASSAYMSSCKKTQRAVLVQIQSGNLGGSMNIYKFKFGNSAGF